MYTIKTGLCEVDPVKIPIFRFKFFKAKLVFVDIALALKNFVQK